MQLQAIQQKDFEGQEREANGRQPVSHHAILVFAWDRRFVEPRNLLDFELEEESQCRLEATIRRFLFSSRRWPAAHRHLDLAGSRAREHHSPRRQIARLIAEQSLSASKELLISRPLKSHNPPDRADDDRKQRSAQQPWQSASTLL